MINPKDIPMEKAIFAAAWKLMVEGLEAKEDKDWETVVGHAGELYEAGSDKATRGLASSLALGVMDYLGARAGEGCE